GTARRRGRRDLPGVERDARDAQRRRRHRALLRRAPRAARPPTSEAMTAMECSFCRTPMQSLGQVPVRTGGTTGAWHMLLGEWADVSEGVIPLDVFRCARCRRVEFF